MINIVIFVPNEKINIMNLQGYTLTEKTLTHNNGNISDVYEKKTKSGIRFYYLSEMRMIQVSKKEIV